MTVEHEQLSRWGAPHLWLLGILAGFLALQSIYFSHRWVVDESWYLMPIPSILEEGRFRIPTVPGDDVFWPQPPLLTYSEALLELVRPLSVAGARALPLALGCVLIVVTYLLGRRLYGEAVGVLAAALVASDNLIFLAARTVRPEILVALFVATTLLVLSGDAGRRRLALAGLCAGMGVWSHPNGLLAPGCGLLLLLARQGTGRRGLQKGVEFALWTFLAVLPLVAWIVINDLPSGFEGFKTHWLGRYGRLAEEDPTAIGSVLALVRAEIQGRWSSFVQAPYRIHIAIISVLVIARSLSTRDPLLRALGAGCILQLLFFIFVNNSVSSVRYMTPLIALLSVAAAQWACALWSRSEGVGLMDGRRWLALAIGVSLGLSQVVGNGVYLWRARYADYPATVEALNELIPDDSRVYGALTLWMGLRNHYYVPYMRMPWKRALAEHDPNVVIMDDYVMAEPDGRFAGLRSELAEYLEEQHWTLLGEVDGKFYGQMKVYAAPRSDPSTIGETP